MEIVKKITIVDLDGDGDMDVVGCAADNTVPRINVAWFENDGDMNFTPVTISNFFPFCRSVAAGDLDGDGDIDVVTGNTESQFVTWWVNDGTPTGPNWSSNTLTGANDSTYSVSVIDLDGDMDNDILVTFLEGDSLGWYENNGSGSFIYRNINYGYVGAVDLIAARIDNDNDLDLVGAAFFDNLISWWSQTTPGSFSGKTDVSTGFLSPNSVAAGDMDGDGDNDILSAGHYKESGVSWWENLGNGVFGTEQVIASGYEDARNAVFQDVDSDGDMDVVACADLDDDISWWENDGDQGFTKRFVTTTFDYPYYVQSLDFDGDGDMDIIGSAELDDEIAWWENDLDDLHSTGMGNPGPITFYSGEVVIDFSSGDAGNTRVFYNANFNENRLNLASEINHIADRGFFTIYTQKDSAAGDLIFDLSLINDWSNYDNPLTLVICLWNNSTSEWEVAGDSQDFDGTELTVIGVDQNDMAAFSRWTIGSTNSDNPLPVNLVSFEAVSYKNSVKILWQTASELNNLGFELWRKPVADTSFARISSYLENEDLKGQGSSAIGKEYTYYDTDVFSGKTYQYRLADISYNGTETFHQTITVSYTDEGLVRLDDVSLPEGLHLVQNYPNPFNGSTWIKFSIPEDNDGGNVQLLVFNELGQRVKTLYNNSLAAGRYEIIWDGTNEYTQPVSSGMYIYMLQHGINQIFKRMLYVK